MEESKLNQSFESRKMIKLIMTYQLDLHISNRDEV